MKYPIQLLVMLCMGILLWGCSSDDDDNSRPAAEEVETMTVNVDVVLPEDIRADWQNSIDWALGNMEKAQQKERRRVRLNLRFHDEDTADLDSLAFRLTHPEEGDDTCQAIIGPYHSDHAQTFLSYAAQNRLPVIMPTCTSSELQRIHARNNFAWFLTESDITQTEIMISVAHAFKASDVALVYSDNSYGKSFSQWYTYFATEQGLGVAGEGAVAYEYGQDLKPFFTTLANKRTGDKVMLLIALSDATGYEDVCRQAYDFYSNRTDHMQIVTLCADTSNSPVVSSTTEESYISLGVTPTASMDYGFPQAYENLFYKKLTNGEAQMYDALTLIALGASKQWVSPDKCIVDGEQVTYSKAPYGPGLTDYMRSITSSWEGKLGKWDDAGMAISFHEVLAGRDICISGATGALSFDENTHTNILSTTYMLWQLIQEETAEEDELDTFFQPITFLSTSGTSSQALTTAVWEMDKHWQQEFDETDVGHDLPKLADRWAVVISPSTTWANYRHQADAFAMYQLLHDSGYDDDHIVLIVEDNLYNDSKNPFPGEIYVERSEDEDNIEVRRDAIVDYHFTQLQPDDLADIMMGRSSDRLPHVISPTSRSNVFFFWSGHGGSHEGPLWGNEDARTYFGRDRIRHIVNSMREQGMYRRMMFAVETCFSGHWGEALSGQDNVLVITAANPYEESKADVHDATIGIYLSNAFARTFREQIQDTDGYISIYELYKELAKTTIGSHVMLYNQQLYGSVYSENMNEFFPSAWEEEE